MTIESDVILTPFAGLAGKRMDFSSVLNKGRSL